MSNEQPLELDERTKTAIAELEGTIKERYPSAQFEVTRAADDARILHLITTVDVDDPDEVGDLVIDRVAELVAEEGLPIHVIPIRTPERILADLQARPRSVRRLHRTVSSLNPRLSPESP
jgi:hypothetical protein